jgi:predicted metal-dependent HD superfamily phosphohydrolase
MFEEIFRQECRMFISEEEIVRRLWKEIETAYSDPARYYHNLTHLDHIALQLGEVKDKLNNWLVIVLSVAYHDIVYNTIKQDNEEKSADLAFARLGTAGLPRQQAEQCRHYIVATKSHELSSDTDCNYFTDADLAILGADDHSYKQYSRQIRKEYKYYPDFLYRVGRRKVLTHFLNKDKIFKTSYFQNKYEEKARANILNELQLLC